MDFIPHEVIQIAVILFIALAVGGGVFAIIYPYFSGEAGASKRVKNTVYDRKSEKSSLASRFADDPKENRRRQIQESLEQFEEDTKKYKKRLTLRDLIMQAGLSTNLKTFWLFSIGLGFVCALGGWIGVGSIYMAIPAFIVGALGLPRWILNIMRRRRQDVFLNDFADAIDVIVRGLKAGLPIGDAMKVIATETGPPVGPEFSELVEGQRVGITLNQGLDRMYERTSLSEVKFLGIVLAIQAKTGGNLSEALANLSLVLRERKKMKAKIRSVSQEAKSSAMIVGSLPFIIGGGMMVLNPTYLAPLFDTFLGNVMLVGSGLWMSCGILTMKKMISFDF